LAKDGEVLIAPRIASAVESFAHLAGMGEVDLKGLSRAIAVSNLVELHDDEKSVIKAKS
jgi:hypothetical protein